MDSSFNRVGVSELFLPYVFIHLETTGKEERYIQKLDIDKIDHYPRLFEYLQTFSALWPIFIGQNEEKWWPLLKTASVERS